MIKAFECVRRGCLHVQSEACLTREKVPLTEGKNGGPWRPFEIKK